jgi:hypothetical protein
MRRAEDHQASEMLIRVGERDSTPESSAISPHAHTANRLHLRRQGMGVQIRCRVDRSEFLREVKLTYVAENSEDDHALAILTYGEYDPYVIDKPVISELDGFGDTRLARLLMKYATASGLAWAKSHGLHAESEQQRCPPPSPYGAAACGWDVKGMFRYSVRAFGYIVHVLDRAAGNHRSS